MSGGGFEPATTGHRHRLQIERANDWATTADNKLQSIFVGLSSKLQISSKWIPTYKHTYKVDVLSLLVCDKEDMLVATAFLCPIFPELNLYQSFFRMGMTTKVEMMSLMISTAQSNSELLIIKLVIKSALRDSEAQHNI